MRYYKLKAVQQGCISASATNPNVVAVLVCRFEAGALMNDLATYGLWGSSAAQTNSLFEALL